MFLQKYLMFLGIVVNLSWCQKIQKNVTQEWGGLVAPYAKDCLSETHTDAKGIDELFNGSRALIPTEMGCFLKCVYNKLKIIDSNGNFDTNYLITPDTPSMTPELVKKCTGLASDEKDLCNQALVFGNCIDQNCQYD
ncbi:hypothetical protein FQR65_LT09869 [Abscondita terminalis]|nr:hypothetical protein FQR65_LT09869 [Abscondita terminalis]